MENKFNGVVSEGARVALEMLKNAGYKAYIVGGCVRDMLLGDLPSDWDITTDATPEEISCVFEGYRQIEIGRQHGTISVFIGDEQYEITTFRADGDYSDGRRPDEVFYTKSLEEDLKRRDFTINALAFNFEEGLVDHFGGVRDLGLGVIRCVGDPKERFGEDYLRILRAYRFAARLGFVLDEGLVDAAVKLCVHIQATVSKERIVAELEEILLSPNLPAVMKFFRDIGEGVFPDAAVVIKDRFEYFSQFYEMLPPTIHHRLAAVYWIGKMGANIALYPSFGKEVLGRVAHMLHHAEMPMPTTRSGIKRSISKVGFASTMDIIKFQGAMREATFHDILSMDDMEAVFVKDLMVTGGDVMDFLDIPPGPIVGEILGFLLEAVIKDPTLNNPATLQRLAREEYLRR